MFIDSHERRLGGTQHCLCVAMPLVEINKDIAWNTNLALTFLPSAAAAGRMITLSHVAVADTFNAANTSSHVRTTTVLPPRDTVVNSAGSDARSSALLIVDDMTLSVPAVTMALRASSITVQAPSLCCSMRRHATSTLSSECSPEPSAMARTLVPRSASQAGHRCSHASPTKLSVPRLSACDAGSICDTSCGDALGVCAKHRRACAPATTTAEVRAPRCIAAEHNAAAHPASMATRFTAG